MGLILLPLIALVAECLLFGDAFTDEVRDAWRVWIHGRFERR